MSDATFQATLPKLMIFGPTKIFHNWQREPNDCWWSDAAALGGDCLQLVIGRNADGRMEVFYIGTDSQIYHNKQDVPNAPFQGQVFLGGIAKQIAMGYNADGRIELFYIGGDDQIYHNKQGVPNGPFQGQEFLGGITNQVVIGNNADGRMELFYIGGDGQIYHNKQGVPNGPFQGQEFLGGITNQVVIGNNADGRMELFYIGGDGRIYHNKQGVPNGPFQGQVGLGGGEATQVAVGKNADGRMEVLYVGADHNMYYQYQGAPNAPFFAAGPFLFLGSVSKILAVGNNKDGRIEVFYHGRPAPNGPLVVHGLENVALTIQQPANIQVETRSPVTADTKVKISSVANPYFSHTYWWWEDPGVVSIQGSGEAVIPEGQSKVGFALTPVKPGFAWIKAEADGYIQVQDVGPEWTVPSPQMVHVFAKIPMQVVPGMIELAQGASTDLKITFDSPPGKDCPVRLLLAHDSPLSGYVSFPPDVIVPAGQSSATAKVTALKMGPASGDLGLSSPWDLAGATCHMTVKGAPAPAPTPKPTPTPTPAPATAKYSVLLNWKPGNPMYVQSDPIYATPTATVLKVGNKAVWGKRCVLVFPNGYVLNDQAEAKPADLGLTAHMLGMVITAIPCNPLDGQTGEWDVWVEFTYTP